MAENSLPVNPHSGLAFTVGRLRELLAQLPDDSWVMVTVPSGERLNTYDEVPLGGVSVTHHLSGYVEVALTPRTDDF